MISCLVGLKEDNKVDVTVQSSYQSCQYSYFCLKEDNNVDVTVRAISIKVDVPG